MQKKGNFLLMDKSEFRGWLAGQKITRTITKMQVHHTASPNYVTRRMVNGVAQQDHFACLEGMRNYHLSEGWSGTGQNITTFEDGKIAISLDRDLNATPAGIRGANTGALCIENVGNFDKGGDTMTPAQRETIVHLYACLCEKLGLTPSVNTIVYHAWYTADGTWLGDYSAGKSSKTCPGTNFWGAGNTKAAAQSTFIPAVAAELARLKNGGSDVKKDEIVAVKVNGKKIAEGIVDCGVTYIPVRAVAEALGANVAYDAKTKMVTITKEGA
ncbi:N-acetylmuramoyl-L-alanine amidase [Paenibacillus tuaregi]|uniref:N-acetylmuramoyl-L-alanine amidase n=1 Tax=Paenibacillus tuaregi TaxID=1816681 RepID=UPI00083952E4|nr:N-acetylmuramoyl-L-alanine amidase [Paenibacillus tuaregi]